MLDADEFHDYACAKAYDILSRGRYKKFLIQSRAAGEEWACKSVRSVQSVQAAMDEVQVLLEALSSPSSGKKRKNGALDSASLAEACMYVLNMPLPPKKRRSTPSTCCVTGIKLRAEVCTCF